MKKTEKLNIFSIILLLTSTQMLFSNDRIMIISILLLGLCFIINYKYNNFFINKRHFLVIFIGCVVSMILPLYNSNFSKNIYSTVLVWGTILLLFLVVSTQNNKKYILINVFKYFSYITVFLILYGSFLYVFGNKFMAYDIMNKSYYQQLNIGNMRLIQSAIGDLNGRFLVGSLTGNPNTLSFMSAFSIAYFVILSNSKRRILSLIICFIGLLISGSRLGIILLLIVLVLNYLLKKVDFSNKKNIFALLFFIFIVFAIIIINYNTIYSNIDFNGRTLMWDIGKSNISLIGHGINSDNIFLYNYLNISTSMHNSYISLLVNYGVIIGSIIMMFFVIFLNNVLSCSYNNKINRFIFVVSILILFIGMSESTFLIFNFYNSLLFYLINYFYISDREEK